jgi:hypothetical protein
MVDILTFMFYVTKNTFSVWNNLSGNFKFHVTKNNNTFSVWNNLSGNFHVKTLTHCPNFCVLKTLKSKINQIK